MNQAIQNKAEQIQSALDPWYWAYSQSIALVGGPFSLDGHEFQVRPMSVNPPVKVIKKATQTTFTESEVLRCIHGLIHGQYPKGILYLFPSKEEVTDFSSSRFNPLIHDNPDSIGSYVRETNRANLRRVGTGFIYFRSGRLGTEIQGQARSSSHLKSIPVDHAVHDEYDEMHGRIDEFVSGRLSKSDIGTKVYLANPTLPDYGISAKFDQSSEEYWHIRCRSCGAWTCLDDPDSPRPFPGCLLRVNGSVIRACSRCDKPLDPRMGEWVAKKPQITDCLGFSIGHPSVSWVDPAELLRVWEDPATDRANFIRLRLGREYIEAENRLSIQEVYSLCNGPAIASDDPGPCYMGVDQGKGLHVVIGGHHADHPSGQVVHVNEYRDWEDLDKLMKAFNVSRCVVDALPETRNARAFAERNKGRVFINYYVESQKQKPKWNEEDMTVSINRTESLDMSHQDIQAGKVLLPQRCEAMEEFAKHCHNVAKKLEEDDQTGSKRYVYVKLGPDHYRHAYNYMVMARPPEGGFFAGGHY